MSPMKIPFILFHAKRISLLTIFVFLNVVWMFCGTALAQEGTSIAGKIQLKNGEPAAYANVYIDQTPTGTITEDDGSFKLLIPDSLLSASLTISYIGFEERLVTVTSVLQGEGLIILSSEKKISTKLVDVVEKRPALKPRGLKKDFLGLIIDEVDAGDIASLTSTMPGAQKRDNDSYVYVRGGDYTETQYILDGAYLLNPYLMNSGFGGIGSSLGIFDTKSYFYSSGGFSSKYTSAMSGIVEVRSANFQKDFSSTYLGIAPMSAFMFGTIPLNNKMNMHLELMGYHLEPFFSVNNELFSENETVDNFTDYPRGLSAKMRVNVDVGNGGNLKFSGLYNSSSYGLGILTPDQLFNFNSDEENQHFNALFTKFLTPKTGFESNVAYSRYNISFDNEDFNTESLSQLFQWNSYLNYYFNEQQDLQFGFNAHLYDIDNNQLYSDAYSDNFRRFSAVDSNRVAVLSGFADYKWDFSPMVSMNIGARLESAEEQVHLDPRASLFLKPGDLIVKLSAGRYSQIHRPVRYNLLLNQNMELITQRADHYMVDLEYNKGNDFSIMGGVYYKDYQNLPLNFRGLYTSDGEGEAYGVDMRLKYRFEMLKRYTLFSINASLNNTDKRTDIYQSLVPATTDVPLSIYAFLSMNVDRNLKVNLIQSFGKGRPYSDSQDYLQNRRLPDNYSTDITAVYKTLFGKWNLSFNGRLSNIFGVKNIYGYNYNADFTERVPQFTGSITSLVFGVSLSRY